MEEITMMYWGNRMGGWGMLLMSLSGLLFWSLIILGIMLLARSAGRGGRPGAAVPHASTPQQGARRQVRPRRDQR
jgi:putative membrane protein